MNSRGSAKRSFRVMFLQCSLALAVTFYWPIVYAGPNYSQLVGAIGVVTWVAVIVSAATRDRLVARTASPTIFIPFALIGLAFVASIGRGEIDMTSVVYFLLIVVPVMLTPALTSVRFPMKLIAILALAFQLLQFLMPSQVVNPIVRGHLGWIGVIAFLLWDDKRYSYVGVAVGAVAFIQSFNMVGKLGPLLGAGTALLAMAVLRLRAPGPRVSRRLLQRGRVVRIAALAGGAGLLLFLTNAIAGEEELPRILSHVQVRELAWRDVLSGSLLGEGLRPLSILEGGRKIEVVYAHNFLVDAYRLAGIIGALLVAGFAVRALWSAWHRGDRNFPLYAGLVAAHLTSGGLLYSPVLWATLAAAISTPEDDRQAIVGANTEVGSRQALTDRLEHRVATGRNESESRRE